MVPAGQRTAKDRRRSSGRLPEEYGHTSRPLRKTRTGSSYVWILLKALAVALALFASFLGLWALIRYARSPVHHKEGAPTRARGEGAPAADAAVSENGFKRTEGKLGPGHEVGRGRMTLADAKEHCLSLRTCYGFSFAASAVAGGATDIVFHSKDVKWSKDPGQLTLVRDTPADPIRFMRQYGFLARGELLFRAAMTVRDGAHLCASMPACVGIVYKRVSDMSDDVVVNFKSIGSDVSFVFDQAWMSFVKPAYAAELLHQPMVDMLLTKVRIRRPRLPKSHQPRLFCFIAHETGGRHAAIAQRDTWARRCNAHVFAQETPDSAIPSVRLPALGVDLAADPLARKLALWRYVHDGFLPNFEYFFLGQQGLWVAVETMRSLYEAPLAVPHGPKDWGFFGRSLQIESTSSHVPRVGLMRDVLAGHSPMSFPDARGGYAMSRAALKALIAAVDSGDCPGQLDVLPAAQAADFAAEIVIAACLMSKGFEMSSTDSSHAQRFHPMTPLEAVINKKNSSAAFAEFTAHERPRPGESCCADDTISFTGLGPRAIVRLHKAVYSHAAIRNLKATSYSIGEEKDEL